MGILLCEQNFRNVWIRNESVRAEIGQILHTDTHPHTHTHTTAAKLVVRIACQWTKLDIAGASQLATDRERWRKIINVTAAQIAPPD